MDEFVSVEVEEGEAAPDGVGLRFMRADGPVATVARLRYESDDGLEGWWHVYATDDPTGTVRTEARTARINDSSEGTVRLVWGGTQGLVLVHESTGTVVREPYLVLSLSAAVE